jgi:broad specificity phosphatase PhoE
MGEIWLLRHGQASLGAADYDQLSDLGQRQAKLAGRALAARGVQVDRVICGSMRRHWQTARGCLAGLGSELEPIEDVGWNEYDHEDVLAVARPDLADPTRIEAEVRDGEELAQAFVRVFFTAVERWVGGEHDGDYVESWPACRARVDGAMGRLEAGLAPGEVVLVCTSGGPVASASARLLGMPDDHVFRLVRALANGALTRVARVGPVLRLSSYNETAHLAEAGAVSHL